MEKEQAKLERFRAGAQAMSADERKALWAAMCAAQNITHRSDRQRMMSLVTEIGAAKGRAVKRQQSDSRTDAKRRKLVGARLPIEQAERCKNCAKFQGVSEYRFTAQALMLACERAEQTAGHDGQPDGGQACAPLER